MIERGFEEVFNWSFLGAFATATTAVVAVANTLRQWFALEPRWSALIAAEVLSFYAAANAGTTWEWWTAFVVLAEGALLCAYAVGVQATVAGIRQRVTGVAGRKEGWWAPWF